eukprot:gene28447-50304_t
MTTANIVKANDRDSATNEVILVRGAEASFANFMSKNAKKLVKTNDWNIFTEVVTLYNASPSKFMTLSADKKEAFVTAVENIEVKLNKVRGSKAKIWKQKVTKTASVIKVLWNYQSNVESTDTEQAIAPEAIEMLAVGLSFFRGYRNAKALEKCYVFITNRVGCAKSETQNSTKAYFDLAGLVNQQITELNKNQP